MELNIVKWHKLELLELYTNLAIVWGPHIVCVYGKNSFAIPQGTTKKSATNIDKPILQTAAISVMVNNSG